MVDNLALDISVDFVTFTGDKLYCDFLPSCGVIAAPNTAIGAGTERLIDPELSCPYRPS